MGSRISSFQKATLMLTKLHSVERLQSQSFLYNQEHYLLNTGASFYEDTVNLSAQHLQ